MLKKLKAAYRDNVANTHDLHLSIPIVDGGVMRHSDAEAHEIIRSSYIIIINNFYIYN